MEKIMKKAETRMLLIVTAFSLILTCKTVQAKTVNFSAAEHIRVNEAVTDNVTGGYYEERNVYHFRLKHDGHIMVNFQSPLQESASCYWKLSLYGGDYVQMDTMYATGNHDNQNMTEMGLPAGDYYIEVASSSGNRACSSDTYRITVNYAASSKWEKEPNDSFPNATVIKRNKEYSGTTKSGSNEEKDFFRFNIEKSDMYDIHMFTEQMENASVYWMMELYSSSYQKIARTLVTGNYTEQGITKRLAKGNYYVLIKSGHAARSLSNSRYRIKVSKSRNAWNDTNDEEKEDDAAEENDNDTEQEDDEEDWSDGEEDDLKDDESGAPSCTQDKSSASNGNAVRSAGKQNQNDGDGISRPEPIRRWDTVIRYEQ